MGFLIQTSTSGIYTPTVSNETNNITVDATIGSYIKVGSIVNCFIQLEISTDVLQNNGNFELSLPIASNFTNNKNLIGLLQWSDNGILANITKLTITAETTNNTCFIDIETLNFGQNMQFCVLNIQYQVI